MNTHLRMQRSVSCYVVSFHIDFLCLPRFSFITQQLLIMLLSCFIMPCFFVYLAKFLLCSPRFSFILPRFFASHHVSSFHTTFLPHFSFVTPRYFHISLSSYHICIALLHFLFA